VVGQSKEDISDCKGLRDDATATKCLPKSAKISKNGLPITSVVCDISMQFCFEIYRQCARTVMLHVATYSFGITSRLWLDSQHNNLLKRIRTIKIRDALFG